MARKTIADLELQLKNVTSQLGEVSKGFMEIENLNKALNKKIKLLKDEAPSLKEAYLGLRKAHEAACGLQDRIRGETQTSNCFQCNSPNSVEIEKMEPLEAFTKLAAYLEAFWDSSQDKVKVDEVNSLRPY